MLRTPADPVRDFDAELRKLADGTGGAYFRGGNGATIERVMDSVASLEKGRHSDTIKSPQPIGVYLLWPALALLLGLPIRAAVGTSLVVIGIPSAAALAAHLVSSSGAHVDWLVGAVFTASAVVGALAGSRAGRRVPVHRLAQGFAVLVVGVSVFLVAKNVAAL